MGFPGVKLTLLIGTAITRFITILGPTLNGWPGGCVALSPPGTGKTLLAKAVAGEVPV